MNGLERHVLDTSATAPALTGCWKLGQGQALTLRPLQPGVLRIAQGRVWITFDHACQDDGVQGGDHVLLAGDSLSLLPGQTLVMESWCKAQHKAAYFSWDPLPAHQGVTLSTRRIRLFADGPRWRAGVLQPLRDLGLALGQAGTALARLGAGLVMVPACALLSLAPRFAMQAATARKRTTGK